MKTPFFIVFVAIAISQFATVESEDPTTTPAPDATTTPPADATTTLADGQTAAPGATSSVGPTTTLADGQTAAPGASSSVGPSTTPGDGQTVVPSSTAASSAATGVSETAGTGGSSSPASTVSGQTAASDSATTVSGTSSATSAQSGSTVAATTVASTAAGSPALPTCADNPPNGDTSFCQKQINLRPKGYCSNNVIFGRFQCCATCAKSLGGSTGSSDKVVQDLASGNKPCTDQRGSDGTSFTKWCVAKAVGRPKTAYPNCYIPLIQARCMRSCGLCPSGK